MKKGQKSAKHTKNPFPSLTLEKMDFELLHKLSLAQSPTFMDWDGLLKFAETKNIPPDAEELIEAWRDLATATEKERLVPDVNQPLISDVFPLDEDKTKRRVAIIRQMRRIEKEILEDQSQKYLEGRISELNRLARSLAIETVYQTKKGEVCRCVNCQRCVDLSNVVSVKRRLITKEKLQKIEKKQIWKISFDAKKAHPGFQEFPYGWMVEREGGKDVSLNDLFPEDVLIQ